MDHHEPTDAHAPDLEVEREPALPQNERARREGISKQDLHLQTASSLAQLIASAEPGMRLPTERDLCAQLGIGRSTLREAIRAFAFIGAVRVRQGSGTYVCGHEDSQVDRLIALGLMVQRSTVHEVIEARRVLEVQAVRMAAEHHDSSDREELREIMRKMSESVDVPAEASRYDLQYHVRLARCCHNSVLVYFINGMRGLFEIWINRAVDRRPVIEDIIGEHNSILDAVFARNADLAAARMTIHLTNAGERLFSVIGNGQSAADYISVLLAGSMQTNPRATGSDGVPAVA